MRGRGYAMSNIIMRDPLVHVCPSRKAIDIERVVDSQLSASSYTHKPNMLRHACAEFR